MTSSSSQSQHQQTPYSKVPPSSSSRGGKWKLKVALAAIPLVAAFSLWFSPELRGYVPERVQDHAKAAGTVFASLIAKFPDGRSIYEHLKKFTEQLKKGVGWIGEQLPSTEQIKEGFMTAMGWATTTINDWLSGTHSSGGDGNPPKVAKKIPPPTQPSTPKIADPLTSFSTKGKEESRDPTSQVFPSTAKLKTQNPKNDIFAGPVSDPVNNQSFAKSKLPRDILNTICRGCNPSRFIHKEIDLNNDGSNEFLVQSSGSQGMGGRANFTSWIFMKIGGDHKQIFTSYGGSVEKLNSETNGFADLRQEKRRMSSKGDWNSQHRAYTWNGKHYVTDKELQFDDVF